ncbi:MAG: DUF3105 domain-containing protein [Solirubrobacterales bacterium]
MASRKEERERLRELREEKEAELKARQRKRLLAAYSGGAFLAIIVVVGGIIALAGNSGESGSAHVSLQSGQTNGVAVDERYGIEPPPVEQADLHLAATAAGCEVRAKLPIEGRSHLPEDSPAPKYSSNPATSGNHVLPPYQQADGAYAETPQPVSVVHSLEHGRIAVQYSSELPEEDQRALRGVYDNAYSAALLFPNDRMPYEVAVSSWGELLGCFSYQGQATLDAIRAFGARYQGTAPEPVEAFGPLAGPTFAGSSAS